VARNQLWDQGGNLIIDEEMPDEVIEPTPEERIDALENALLALMME
jgi:hypothetical protein